MFGNSLSWVQRAPLEEFESKLSERTGMPDGTSDRIYSWPEEKLRARTRGAAKIIKRFATAVAASMDVSSTASTFVNRLDLNSISRDHDWRQVFGALRGEGSDYQQRQAVALRKYLQYLNSRRDLLEYICTERARLDETSAGEDKTQPNAVTLAKLKQLPVGDTVAVRLPESGTLAMRIGRHAFGLSDIRAPRLVDEHGHEYPLRQGRQSVGRHPESDVRLDPNLSDISRLHLVIEWRGGNLLHLTDLSSRGTFVDVWGLQADSESEIDKPE